MDPQRFLEGVWIVNSVDSRLSVQGSPTSNATEDLSSENLQINWSRNGTFVSNTDISLTKLIVASSENRQGNYTYVVDNNRHILLMELFDANFEENVYLKFEILNPASNSPVLQMSREFYLDSVEETTRNLFNTQNAESLQIFASRILNINFSLNCQKQL